MDNSVLLSPATADTTTTVPTTTSGPSTMTSASTSRSPSLLAENPEFKSAKLTSRTPFLLPRNPIDTFPIDSGEESDNEGGRFERGDDSDDDFDIIEDSRDTSFEEPNTNIGAVELGQYLPTFNWLFSRNLIELALLILPLIYATKQVPSIQDNIIKPNQELFDLWVGGVAISTAYLWFNDKGQVDANNKRGRATTPESALLSNTATPMVSWILPLYNMVLPILICLVMPLSENSAYILRFNLYATLFITNPLPSPPWLKTILLTLVAPPKYIALQGIYVQTNSLVSSLVHSSLVGPERTLVTLLLTNFLLAEELVLSPTGSGLDPVMLIFQTALFGLALAIYISSPYVERIMYLSSLPRHKRPEDAEALKRSAALKFAILTITVLLMVVRPYLSYRLGGVDPFVYIFNEFFLPASRSSLDSKVIPMVVYWIVLLAIFIPLIHSVRSHMPLDLRRKSWHYLVVVIFLPTLAITPSFSRLALGGAITLFLLLEFIRATTIPPVGKYLHDSLVLYTDARDTCGPIIVSHIFLILGISLPVLLNGSTPSPSGVICLGLGDSTASLIGKRLGRHKWPNSNKSIEGTLAMMVAMALGIYLAKSTLNFSLRFNLHDDVDDILVVNNTYHSLDKIGLGGILTVTALTSLLEGIGEINDNVIVPLYMWVLLELLKY